MTGDTNMSEKKHIEQEVALEKIIETSIQVPGVKVDRKAFLTEIFSQKENWQDIVENGPVQAGITQEDLKLLSGRLIFKRTSESSIASFAAGIPGGLAIAATIPADLIQFFGISLRLAQEISYLYGAEDLWENGIVDSEKVRNQLILYCGVMFGVSSAVSGVRVLSTQIAKTTLKKLPQKALTKTFWYPIVKQIGKALGIKVTKSTVASGVSKAIPVIGGVISGTINFASMMPMANRLQKTFDKASFDYTQEEFEADIKTLEDCSGEDDPAQEKVSLKDKMTAGLKKSKDDVSGWISRKKEEFAEKKSVKAVDRDEIIDTIRSLKELLDTGIITQEEFDQKKTELMSRL